MMFVKGLILMMCMMIMGYDYDFCLGGFFFFFFFCFWFVGLLFGLDIPGWCWWVHMHDVAYPTFLLCYRCSLRLVTYTELLANT